jgi:hypothetical protein
VTSAARMKQRYQWKFGRCPGRIKYAYAPQATTATITIRRMNGHWLLVPSGVRGQSSWSRAPPWRFLETEVSSDTLHRICTAAPVARQCQLRLKRNKTPGGCSRGSAVSPPSNPMAKRIKPSNFARPSVFALLSRQDHRGAEADGKSRAKASIGCK